MKTAVLVTYHWPPSGGAGVHRWLKMAKYLREFGWDLIVFTPSNAQAPAVDFSLETDVLPDQRMVKIPVRDPYSLYKWLTGRSNTPMYSGFIEEPGSRHFLQGLAVWLRGNVFIPDPRRTWVGPATRRLRRLLREESVQALISTGPPHSMHLIACRSAAESGLPWVADFRDPWTAIDYYHDLKLTRWADHWHRQLESRVLRSADRVVTVSKSWASDLATLAQRPVDHISNGFDPADFPVQKTDEVQRWTLGHFGSMNADRNPVGLWRALAELRRRGVAGIERLRLLFYGPVDSSIRASTEDYGVSDLLDIRAYIPHQEAISVMQNCAALLLPVNRSHNAAGVVPGKLFEYLATRRPVLLIGPQEGDAAELVKRSGAGWTADYDDVEKIITSLNVLLEHGENGGELHGAEQDDVEQYSRRELAGQYANLLNDLVHCEKA